MNATPAVPMSHALVAEAARLQVAERMAMAIRTARKCNHREGDPQCQVDKTCRALAAWEAMAR